MRLRPFRSKDEAELADVWFESWRSIGLEAPIVTKADLLRRLPKDLRERWTVTVAETDHRIVGFIALALAERRIDQLFVAPAYQGRGVGRALFGLALEQLPEGFWLATQPNNLSARRFYERCGMSLERIEPGLSGGRAFYIFPPMSD